MHDSVMRGKWIGRRMSSPKHAVFDRGSGESRGKQHAAASIDIAGMTADFGKAGDGEFESFVGIDQRESVSFFCDGSLDCVRDGVDSGASRDTFGLRKG